MDYKQTTEYLFAQMPSFQNVGAGAYKPGLERVSAFADYLGTPHNQYVTIHVAGTNGKGSTSHMLASILAAAGYKTGLYTSPHLHDFRERIRINGEVIPQQRVVDFVERHREKMEQLSLSFFEMTTLLAFDYFATEQVDVAVIETGLGGRLDATNIIKPVLSVVTNIGLDHQAFLGTTIAKIASEKAGIIKASTPVVVGERAAESDPVFEAKAESLASPLLFAEDAFRVESREDDCGVSRFDVRDLREGYVGRYGLDMLGEYQSHNIVTTLASVAELRRCSSLKISDEVLLRGLRQAAQSTHLQGRWQILGQHPLTVCDTGHNSHGIKYVAHQLSVTPHRELYMVIGFVNDKDITAVLAMLPRKAHYFFTQAATQRAVPCDELMHLGVRFGLHGGCYRTVAEALAAARARAGAEDMIFIGGSNFIVAEVV